MNRVTFQPLLWGLAALFCFSASASERPDTGISGVYEVMVGVADPAPVLEHFAQFGFTVVEQALLDARQAKRVYGVESALTSYRLQNGGVDTHGLLRILHWAQPQGAGVGYASPTTVGQWLAVMRTRDIVRLDDIFRDARNAGQQWLPIEPIYDDLYSLTDGEPGIVNRRVGVRESGIYGQWFNHVFFQRYGYQIPGYGSIGEHSPLQSSEFTHHDFIIRGDIDELTDYYESVLGFQPEAPTQLNGDWQPGPQRVFQLKGGASQHYRGFVSPNNICGKLKFIAPQEPAGDRLDRVKPGALGINLHSLYTPKLELVHQLAKRAKLKPSAIVDNEFNESSFVFTGPDGAIWQIMAQTDQGQPVTELTFDTVNN